jgi:hypothetical protein
MRTTINLPDRLLAQARRLAAGSGTTLTALLEEALRRELADRRRRRGRRRRAALTTFGTRGLQPGVDLDDSAALLDLIEPPGAPARR